MILIGQFDSPFVRRVAIAMRLYGIAFEHRPWSVFGDPDKIAQYNPLMRVPTLVMDDGEVVIESSSILDALDQIAGPAKALIPATGDARRHALKVCSLATGMCDKAVSLVYETHVHKRATAAWTERCLSQIAGCLSELEANRGSRPTQWWFGSNLTHADIAAGVALRFLGDVHPGLFDIAEGWPLLAAHAAKCESLPVFQDISQAFRVAPIKS
jgi:glutathione S-transferase